MAHAPDPSEDLAASMQSLVLCFESIADFSTKLAALASERVVEGEISCGITARRERRSYTVGSSDDSAAKVDETQYASYRGPCLHSFETGEIVDIPDLRTDDRWPAFCELAMGVGLKSSLSVPLESQGHVIATMNLYSFRAPNAFNEAAHRRAQNFATQASNALAVALQLSQRDETNQHLETALSSRMVIDQALGVLMAQQRCSAAEAFELLRVHSQNNNRKLRDIAADVITKVTGSAPQPGRQFRHRREDS